jgi:hypothetical protein
MALVPIVISFEPIIPDVALKRMTSSDPDELVAE